MRRLEESELNQITTGTQKKVQEPVVTETTEEGTQKKEEIF